jgi:hypothetical protein
MANDHYTLSPALGADARVSFLDRLRLGPHHRCPPGDCHPVRVVMAAIPKPWSKSGLKNAHSIGVRQEPTTLGASTSPHHTSIDGDLECEYSFADLTKECAALNPDRQH